MIIRLLVFSYWTARRAHACSLAAFCVAAYCAMRPTIWVYVSAGSLGLVMKATMITATCKGSEGERYGRAAMIAISRKRPGKTPRSYDDHCNQLQSIASTPPGENSGHAEMIAINCKRPVAARKLTRTGSIVNGAVSRGALKIS